MVLQKDEIMVKRRRKKGAAAAKKTLKSSIRSGYGASIKQA